MNLSINQRPMSSDGIIRVSSKSSYSAYVNAVKFSFKTQSRVELHGLGEAIANTVRAAEMLCSLGYATMMKFETMTLADADQSGVQRRRSKAVITLEKAATFDTASAEFEKTRASAKK